MQDQAVEDVIGRISVRMTPVVFMLQAQGVGAFLPTTDSSAPAPSKDLTLASLVDDSPQKRLMAQKATPPPSPLLSELLKKGNLISASPRLVRPAGWTGGRGGSSPSPYNNHKRKAFINSLLIQSSSVHVLSLRWGRGTPPGASPTASRRPPPSPH